MTTAEIFPGQYQQIPSVRGSNGYTVRLPLSPTGGGLICLPRGSKWEGWELSTSLMVNIEVSEQGWLATTYLAELAEYGFGTSQEDAISELLTSLSDYRVSLEKREERLGPSAKDELTKLRGLIAGHQLK